VEAEAWRHQEQGGGTQQDSVNSAQERIGMRLADGRARHGRIIQERRLQPERRG